jgi:hypothetical protein
MKYEFFCYLPISAGGAKIREEIEFKSSGLF